MKHQWLAYVVIGVLSIGAGVAIAGLPNNVPVDATIIPPTTTEAPEPATATTITVPATTVPATTTPDTTDPDTADLAAATDPDTADSVPAELGERSTIVVAAVNGANVVGIALREAIELDDLGYVDVLPLNGTDIEEVTAVFFAAGFEEAALRMADDFDLPPESVAPIEVSPSVTGLSADIELLVYIGRDRA